jgi:hypothetical protein
MTRYGYLKVHCGDRITERDGRHEGRVNAIDGVTATVKWDNGWIGWLDLDEIVVIERAYDPTATRIPTARPATHAVSPRRELELWMAARQSK